MNKTIKIISTLLIAVLLVATLSQVCLAVDYADVINKVEVQVDGATDVDTSAINSTAGKVIRAIRNVAAVAAVLIITILGIKYMMGSPEEKSGYQKTMIPLAVGIVLVVAAASIATMLFSVA